jgi:hypothetical protein
VKHSVRGCEIEEVWSEWQDLNLRPPRPERLALPGWHAGGTGWCRERPRVQSAPLRFLDPLIQRRLPRQIFASPGDCGAGAKVAACGIFAMCVISIDRFPSVRTQRFD